MKARVILFPFVACFSLASCGDSSEAGAAADTEPAVPGHPWDWIPDEQSLLSGREVYLAECALCHNEGEESAPPLTDQDEWARRIAKGEDVLVTHALEGFHGDDGEMPARGGSDYLTDQQVTNAVRYMINTPK